MKKIYSLTLATILLTSSMVLAAGDSVNPNGFPSGEHYNLNLHGKNVDFVCPEKVYDEFGNPVYGNSVFIPEDGTGIDVVLRSGSGKGKRSSAITNFQAIDPCSSAFDGNPAVVEIPPNSNGYRVYARTLAKPTNNPEMTISPALISAVDENGDDLVYLGQVTDNGFTTPYATFTRSKGKSTAIEITEMFKWTGDVCYFSEPLDLNYTLSNTCCADFDSDLVWDSCEPSVLAEDGLTPICNNPEYQLLDTFCHSYAGEWVFNIADLVEVLWDINNGGMKLLQVRFYPN